MILSQLYVVKVMSVLVGLRVLSDIDNIDCSVRSDVRCSWNKKVLLCSDIPHSYLQIRSQSCCCSVVEQSLLRSAVNISVTSRHRQTLLTFISSLYNTYYPPASPPPPPFHNHGEKEVKFGEDQVRRRRLVVILCCL